MTRERLRDLVRRHGRTATSFQLLQPGIAVRGASDGFVGFADTGDAWVVAGEPVAPEDQVDLHAARFVADARSAGVRPCFFAVERDLRVPGFARTVIGAQPVWDPAAWEDTLRSASRLREQLRRARAKGVIVRDLPPEAFGQPEVREAIDGLRERWQRLHGLPPMAFLVSVGLDGDPERRVVVAEQAGRLIGLATACPVFARGAWLLEHTLRDPDAPNGTTELLVDALLRRAAAHGIPEVVGGIVPLASTDSRALRLVGRATRRWYDAEGLYRFRSRLRPARWEPVHLLHPAGAWGRWRALLDVIRAFAGGGVLPSVLRALRHRRHRRRSAGAGAPCYLSARTEGSWSSRARWPS